MDRDVTVRFFTIIQSETSNEELLQVLKRAWDLPNAKGRERLIGKDVERDIEGMTLRLEHLEDRGGLLIGDITRVQTKNLPGKVTDKTTEKLPFSALGHYTAFCFDPDSSVIALQFDTKVRATRVMQYFSDLAKETVFLHTPLVRDEDAVAKFKIQTAKSFQIRVSKVGKFGKTHSNSDIERKIEELAILADGAAITVKISANTSRSPLDKSKISDWIKIFQKNKAEGGGVAAIYADTYEQEETYNFVSQLLKEKKKLDLPDNDPDGGRKKRLNFVKEVYDKHKSNIRRQTSEP